MNDLKIGDLVEVVDAIHDDVLKKTIFIKYTSDGGIIGVHPNENNSFNQDYSFNTCKWKKNEWCPIPEKEYIPFTNEDDLLGLKVRRKDSNELKALVTYQDSVQVQIDDQAFKYNYAFKEWTFLNGSPFGKLKE